MKRSKGYDVSKVKKKGEELVTTWFAPCQGADCRWAHSSNPLPWGHSIGDLYVFVISKIRDTETKGVSGSCGNDASLVPKCTADQKLLEGRRGQRVGPRTAQVSQLVSGKVCGSKRCGSNTAQLGEKMWGNMFGYILNFWMWPLNLRTILENLFVFPCLVSFFESVNAQFSQTWCQLCNLGGWIADDCTLSGRFVGDALCLHALLLI